MKINLAKSAGFCFGVKRAINIAFQTIASGRKAYMLGNIVHNEEVAAQMQRAGIRKVKKLSPGKDRAFLIRAHGVSLNLVNKARRLGFKITDATCPMVKEIYKIAVRMEKRGYLIIVIGDKKHDEVRGIIGQLKKRALVIDSPQGIPLHKIKGAKKAAIVVQSTQNIEVAVKIAGALRPYIKELKFFNTVCRPTTIKQEEIKKMPLKNDIMIIIGSKNSANTKRLYEIAKSLNKKSFWIQSERDLKPGWFRDIQSVGLTAGASTPDETIKKIIGYIKKCVNL